MVTVIGRGHSGTRAMSHTLSASGYYMGAQINPSGDLIPPEDMYEACRVMARHVKHRGGLEWDFSKLHHMKIDPAFTRLIESYLSSVLASDKSRLRKGGTNPETTLVFPWIRRMFPDMQFIFWIRDPRDCILGGHVTDDLSRFGIACPATEDVRLRRAISWKYQYDLVRATPNPRGARRWIELRFEDFVLQQDRELKRLEKFLGMKPAKIEVRPEAVGRYRTDTGTHYFDFFEPALREYGYELPACCAQGAVAC